MSAITKRVFTDVGDAAGNRHCGQVLAEFERLVSDVGNTVRDCNIGQSGIFKCFGRNGRDAIGDRVASNSSPWILNDLGLALIE